MTPTTYKTLILGMGGSAAAFGYILVAEQALPTWIFVALLAGGALSALAGVLAALGPFGRSRDLLVFFLFAFVPIPALLVHSQEALYAFFFAFALAAFGMMLQNVALVSAGHADSLPDWSD